MPKVKALKTLDMIKKELEDANLVFEMAHKNAQTAIKEAEAANKIFKAIEEEYNKLLALEVEQEVLPEHRRCTDVQPPVDIAETN